REMGRASVCALRKKPMRGDGNGQCATTEPTAAWRWTTGAGGLTAWLPRLPRAYPLWVRLWVQIEMRELLQQYQRARGPPHFEISLPDFFGDAENCWIVVSVVGRTWALVGLRHRCALRRYDAPPVTRPTVTEIKRNAKDRTAAERMRRYRARERW